MANVIEVENMSFGYTRDMILENVDFAVEEGDFAVIIGDNGVGKSTMVNRASGIFRRTAETARQLFRRHAKRSS